MSTVIIQIGAINIPLKKGLIRFKKGRSDSISIAVKITSKLSAPPIQAK
jgi:hypothetical protein